ncbi:putative F-box protein At3g10240 [Solanum dulcamara]|uniref:putative F-box protein At3g10240 n=1 Tax=Solanum dulcamara TaxID=45834 RepID=UPI0024867585|nr:putative F-box protein At3g10240 [Solanum dulcamara]
MNPSIPKEIVIQIFTWLPVKSIMRFKCVTKFLNSLISESYFTDIHTTHSMTRLGGRKYFLDGSEFYCTSDQEREDVKSSASGVVQIQSFDELPFYIPVGSNLSCANGLFCIQKPAAILNPSTGHVRFLPKLNDNLSMLYYWLGFEPEENKYKVLLTRTTISKPYLKHRVFTLGIDESWRETQSFPYHVMSKHGICINGVIYMFVFHDELLAIDAFDLKTESSKLIVLKNASKWWYYELIEVKGQLAIIDYEKWSREYIHLRVLGQIQKEEEWESHIIHYPSMWKHIPPHVISDVILSCMACDGQILFILNLESGILCSCYDVTRQSWRKIETKGLPTNHRIKRIYSYVETLVM